MARTVPLFFLTLFLFSIAKPLMAQADNSKSFDEIPPSALEALRNVETLLEEGKINDAHQSLLLLSFRNSLTEAWTTYITGLLEFQDENYTEGLKSFQRVVDSARASSAADSSAIFRISAKCLKKIGWYWRKQKEYNQAYGIHAQAFLLYERFGSAEEIHDALISLDVDADLMGDPVLSETALNLSVSAAKKISDDIKRFKALGMSHNNLTFALQKQGRHLEAEDAMLKSVEYWKQYETLAGISEHRVMWAWYGVGDMYEAWAKALGESHVDYSNKLNNSRSAFEKSLALAKEQKAGAEEMQEIEKRLKGAGK